MPVGVFTQDDALDVLSGAQAEGAGLVACGGGGVDRVNRDTAPLPDGTDVHAYLRAGADRLGATLRAADLDAVVWTFRGPRPVRWWLRRQAQETTVHAWDAVVAAGGSLAIAPDVAVDGIDELLDDMAPPAFAAAAFGGAGETIHLHATDATGEWLVTVGPDGYTVGREHAKGDVAARGPAEDLLLALWGRRPLDGLETFGDAGLLARFRAAIAL